MPKRQTLLAGIALLAFLGCAAYWILGSRGTTLNFNKVPLAQVLPVVEKKTKIKILTDLDPQTPVTMMVYQADPAIVWEALAGAVNANVSLRVVLAPDKSALGTFKQTLASGQRPEDWESFRVRLPGPGWGGGDPVDPRSLKLAAPSPWPAGKLHQHLQTLAESSEAVWITLRSWDPEVAFSASGSDGVESAAAGLARKASGTSDVFLWLSASRRGNWGGGGGGGGGEGRPPGTGEGGGRRADIAPEVVERRMEQRIAALPLSEQAGARAQWDRDRAIFQQLRDLPPEQRRDKMQEYFNDPAVQDRIESSQADRDGRRSPESRRERYRDAIARRSQQP